MGLHVGWHAHFLGNRPKLAAPLESHFFFLPVKKGTQLMLKPVTKIKQTNKFPLHKGFHSNMGLHVGWRARFLGERSKLAAPLESDFFFLFFSCR